MERVAIAGARPGADSLLSLLDRIAGSAWFAYGSIFLIQAKVLWGIWEHRDLSSGDTFGMPRAIRRRRPRAGAARLRPPFRSRRAGEWPASFWRS